MSDPVLGLTMLGLIVAAIMMGFPTAFTLMGLGMIFGFLAFWAPGQPWWQNHAFDLIVQRAYGVMTNDTLLSVPLFVLMGYVMERAALVDRMFHAVQLAFRRVPASLAVTTLLVCAFWGIASGIVGAVVVLMGVIALRPMLNAGYDVRLAAGAITAGGTLGILIPPSVMLIVYAAVAGQSIVKLYAAAMLPGFFLTFLYLVYILGWAILNPRIAPRLRPDQYRVPVPDDLRRLERGRSRRVVPGLLAGLVRPGRATGVDGSPVRYRRIATYAGVAVVPLVRLGSLARRPEEFLIRPPGAQDEGEFLARCIRCGECLKVCLTNGLQPVLWEAGLEGLYTPRLVPRLGYCAHTCTLCGQVCPTGAIPRLELEVKQALPLGTAFLNRSRCIPYTEGADCLVCEEHCPVSPKAITFTQGEVQDRQGNKLPVKLPLHRLWPL